MATFEKIAFTEVALVVRQLLLSAQFPAHLQIYV